MNSVTSDADQMVGRVLIMWDRRVLEKLEILVGSFCVVDGFIWACSEVYGPNDNSRRRQMWDELTSIWRYWNVPWCCMGHFNIVHFPSERMGSSSVTPAMKNFLSLLRTLI